MARMSELVLFFAMFKQSRLFDRAYLAGKIESKPHVRFSNLPRPVFSNAHRHTSESGRMIPKYPE
jgi:hypothetical protein